MVPLLGAHRAQCRRVGLGILHVCLLIFSKTPQILFMLLTDFHPLTLLFYLLAKCCWKGLVLTLLIWLLYKGFSQHPVLLNWQLHPGCRWEVPLCSQLPGRTPPLECHSPVETNQKLMFIHTRRLCPQTCSFLPHLLTLLQASHNGRVLFFFKMETGIFKKLREVNFQLPLIFKEDLCLSGYLQKRPV